MLKRLARRKDLKYPPHRYPDSQLPGNERKNYLVIGKGLQIQGGKDPLSAIPISEGFLMSYVKAKPGNGPRLTPGAGQEEGLLLTIQAGDAPAAEWMDADSWIKPEGAHTAGTAN